MAEDSMEDSLLDLIKCMSCSEEVDVLKVLPCQHTICISCLGKVSTTEYDYQCPKCNKTLPMLNGGFGELPESFVTKQIADLLKQKRQAMELSQAGDSDNVHQNATISSKELDLTTLKTELRNAIAAGERWQKCAKAVIKQQSDILDDIPSSSRDIKKSITEYQQKTDKNCREKLQGLSKGLCDTKSELKESANSLRPNIDKMKDAMKHVPDLTKKLSGNRYTADDVAKGKRLLEKLTQLNQNMAKLNIGSPESHLKIRSGDSVRISSFDDDEKLEEFINGKVSHSSVGIYYGVRTEESSNSSFPFHKQTTEKPLVIFPEKFDWVGPGLGCLERAYSKAKLPFRGDRVGIKSSIKTPHFSWKGVKAGKSQGVMKDIDFDTAAPSGDLVVIVDFPEATGWRGLYSEIEFASGCGMKEGDKVRVSSFIPEPSRGWAGVTGSSVGKVKSIKGKKGEEEVTVDFPECKDWVGLATELEHHREPSIGDKVQVKLTVKSPELGWGGVSHEDVGILQEVMRDAKLGTVAQVHIAGKKYRWSCKLKELELARYQSPNYDTTEQIDGEELLRAVQQAMFMQFSGMY
ncbi:uncharacterized protein [Watersipora subatra]|uniref:uncharacterized protein n=1 Tax=Watersipora subatra TaxID=2589382 RepID=UPI00355C1AB4